ncbi:MAG TPA: hypothetical protein VED63_03095 [Acidimicrobiales bacterium]|nr:hypothetical protein [Acidimicrobiales bacterium]
MADDPLSIVKVRYLDQERAQAIELTYGHGGSERVDGTAGYAADLARKAGLTFVPTSDATRLWVKDPAIWDPE